MWWWTEFGPVVEHRPMQIRAQLEVGFEALRDHRGAGHAPARHDCDHLFRRMHHYPDDHDQCKGWRHGR